MEKRVFVNGTFDVLHPGHVRLLTFAKQQGDFLLVAIDSDIRVKELKGSKRPINGEEERKEMLLALKPVNRVEIFNSSDHLLKLIADYSPDIMVIGSDYKGKNIIGSNLIRDIVYYERIEEYSSTKKIQSIIDR